MRTSLIAGFTIEASKFHFYCIFVYVTGTVDKFTGIISIFNRVHSVDNIIRRNFNI